MEIAAPILLVDDDISLTRLISTYLDNNGFPTVVFHNGQDALHWVALAEPRLVILDIMLPGMDGMSVCRQLRAHYSGPVMMMTALGEDIDEVAGLETGADDYLAKPVRPRVLLARIRALLRRTEQTTTKPQNDQIKIRHLLINPAAREVMINDKPILLTTSEYELLMTLADSRGEIVSRERLHNQILHTPFDGLDRTVDLRISRLRKKIGDDPRNPEIIKTVRTQGYLLVAE